MQPEEAHILKVWVFFGLNMVHSLSMTGHYWFYCYSCRDTFKWCTKGRGMAKKLFRIVLNGVVTWTENAYIAKRGDRAWLVAWRIAKNKGCIAPDSIEVLNMDDGDPIITIEDREDKLQSECECILFTNTYCQLFPDFTNDKKDQGFQFIYKGDSFSLG